MGTEPDMSKHMIAIFHVSNKHTHREEVEQPFIGRTLTVKVAERFFYYLPY